MLTRNDVEAILAKVEEKLQAAQIDVDEVIVVNEHSVVTATWKARRDWELGLQGLCRTCLAEMARANEMEVAAVSLGCQVNNLTATLDGLAGRMKAAEARAKHLTERLAAIPCLKYLDRAISEARTKAWMDKKEPTCGECETCWARQEEAEQRKEQGDDDKG